jgi:hypothetical protein
MEMSLGNSLCCYVKQAKMSCFSFIKSENKRTEQVLSGWVGTSGRGEEGVGKGVVG